MSELKIDPGAPPGGQINSEKYFFDNQNVNNKIWKKIYIKQYITPGSFLIFLEFLLFFCIFPDFLRKKVPKFWKNYTFI